MEGSVGGELSPHPRRDPVLGCDDGCFCLGGRQGQRCNNETCITHDSVSLTSEYGAGLASSSSGASCQSARGCDCEPRLCGSSPSWSALVLVLLLESSRLCGLRPRGCSSMLIADPKLSLDACFFHGRLASSLPTRPAALLLVSSMSCALFQAVGLGPVGVAVEVQVLFQ